MDAITFLRDKCGFSCGDPNSDISKAWAEIERLRKDAERYRWLRDDSGDDLNAPFIGCGSKWSKDGWLTGQMADDAIDAHLTPNP